MEFTLNRHSSTTESSKLQKAIERNREKQAQRNRITPNSSLSSRGSLASKLSKSDRSRPSSTPRQSMHGSSAMHRQSATLQSRNMARKTVETGAESRFGTKLRTPQRKTPSNINYATPRTASQFSKRVAPVRPLVTTSKIKTKFINLVVYLGWAFCFFLLFRLVLADRGVWDYYHRYGRFQAKEQSMEFVKKNNLKLQKEISLIKDNSSYQKKLVRDNLGFISRVEYLVLFPQGNASKTN